MNVSQLIFIALSAFISILVAFLMPMVTAVPLWGQMMAGFVVFLSSLMVFGSKFGAQSAFEQEAKELSKRLNALANVIEKQEKKIASLNEQVQGGASSNQELVAEMKVLQTLLSQIATLKAKQSGDAKSAVMDGKDADAAEDAPQSVAEILQNALKENRVDLYLQPIVSLPARKHVHYECYSRVRDEKGQTIYAKDYMPYAEQTGETGTLDNLLLFRLIQLVRKLGHRRPGVKFFCNISSYSLHDEEFFPQFADFLLSNANLAERIIFEFAQEDIVKMSDRVERNLLTLSQKGYKYSMDQVVDTSFDFANLAHRNFTHVKVDEDVLLGSEAKIHAADLKDKLKRNDITLIASKVEEEKQLLDVLESEIDFGQGYLFGEPKMNAMEEDSEG